MSWSASFSEYRRRSRVRRLGSSRIYNAVEDALAILIVCTPIWASVYILFL